MPLYYRENDVNFIDAINVELINNIIDTTINVFKISLYDTKENLYGEALRKIYFPAVKCAALIEPAETETITDEFGSRITQTIDFRFHRNTLIDIDLVLEVGDIIE
ncbi:MAG: hypothetical protein H8E13_20095 [Actinobacteria bacterium]|nr:hypothetical protein [Actinomycetota bacterium]